MGAETSVGWHVQCLFVVVIRFLITFLNSTMLGLNLTKIDSSVPEFPRADRQTDIADVVGTLLHPPIPKVKKVTV